jgi:RNA polymerase sigma factor (sigma-70 family)
VAALAIPLQYCQPRGRPAATGRIVPAPAIDSAEFAFWEARVVQRAQSGEREALSALYRVFAPELYRRVLLPRLGNVAAAEDALSETFRAAFDQLGNYERRERGIWPWLARIATNKALDQFRSRASGKRALVRFESLCGPLADSSAPASSVERKRQLEDLRGRIDRVFEGLRPRYRRAIELRFFDERSREECAQELEVKLGTFDVLLLRALKAFRAAWQDISDRESQP